MESNSSPRKIFTGLNLEIWGVRISALATVATGILNLLSAVRPALRDRLAVVRAILPLEILHGSRIASALAGFALILLAASLWRRKRNAWLMIVVLLVISTVTHLVKGLDFEEASVSLALLLLLILLRNSFFAASDRPSLRQGLYVLLVAFIFTLGYGTAGFYLLDRHFSVHFGLMDSIRQTVLMFTSFTDPGLEPITGFGRYFADSIYVIAIVSLGFALLMLIRPVLVREQATEEERQRAENIIRRYGHTALARPALFDDKSCFFYSDNTLISYAARGRGALVLGDPIGPQNEIAPAVNVFKDYCARNDWTPAFTSVMPENLAAYKAAGLSITCIGYEAIVSLKSYTLEGSENKNVRNAVNRMEHLGYRVEVHQPPHGNDLLHALHKVSDNWLAAQSGGEMHFSVGWFDESYLGEGPLVVVYAQDGNPTAFANLVTEYRKNELTLDLMRHLQRVENGTMEFLFARMLQWAGEKGYDSFSLGLSALVGIGEKPDDPRIERALHTISEYISRFYNYKGLHNFKEKFHPNWEPRYIAYPGAANLPIVLNTLLKVHSGNNFLWKYLGSKS